MLTHLNINNFIIIDKMNIPFKKGLTIFTGETGAGKSIIIDALEIALGKSVNSTYLRSSTYRLEIEAIFELNVHHPALNWLKNVELDDENLCTLRRTVSSEGQSRCYINGSSVRLPLLKELAPLLMRIHSQHAQQELLKPSMQRNLLDAYAKNEELLQEVGKFYSNWQTLHQAYTKKIEEQEKNKQYQDLIYYQIEELQQAQLQEGEYEKLTQSHQTSTHAEKILKIGHEFYSILNEEEGGNTVHSVSKALTLCRELTRFDESLQAQWDMLNQTYILLKEVADDVEAFLEKINIDPHQQKALEERVEVFFNLARKHSIRPEELYAHTQILENKKISFEQNKEELLLLEKNIADVKNKYFKLALQLSEQRKKAAQKLEIEMTQSMQNLAMKGGYFVVKFEKIPEQELSKFGLEEVKFLVSTNVGQEAYPLAKIVSGGELSRLSLALEVLQIEPSYQKTFVFDEVDTGIGGVTASIVGELLKKLSQQQQVLCITHLPQVAAFADVQIEVIKTAHEDKSALHIKVLDEKTRTYELARMLSGKHTTEASLISAEKMLKLAKEEI